MKTFRQWINDESGQALSEYGLLLALVGVALIASIVAFRGALITKFTAIKDSIAGAS